jgi:hypothetical protein
MCQRLEMSGRRIGSSACESETRQNGTFALEVPLTVQLPCQKLGYESEMHRPISGQMRSQSLFPRKSQPKI